MNRQLTTELSQDEDANMLTQDLVNHGFICEVNLFEDNLIVMKMGIGVQ